jgi:hypothetical protein
MQSVTTAVAAILVPLLASAVATSPTVGSRGVINTYALQSERDKAANAYNDLNT